MGGNVCIKNILRGKYHITPKTIRRKLSIYYKIYGNCSNVKLLKIIQ